VLHLIGRDTNTGGLVRHNAYPHDWSTLEGPRNFQFANWLQLPSNWAPYQAAEARAGAAWSGPGSRTLLSGPCGWHVSQDRPPVMVIWDGGRARAVAWSRKALHRGHRGDDDSPSDGPHTRTDRGLPPPATSTTRLGCRPRRLVSWGFARLLRC